MKNRSNLSKIFLAKYGSNIASAIPEEFDCSKDSLKAATLLLLRKCDEQIEVGLIKRADNIIDHPGEIGLPGGKIEEGETVTESALRECYEEIGLESSAIEIIGFLNPQFSKGRKFLVFPVVALLHNSNCKVVINTMEVNSFFWVKLDFFHDIDARIKLDHSPDENGLSNGALNYNGELVWGLTLRTIDSLIAQ